MVLLSNDVQALTEFVETEQFLLWDELDRELKHRHRDTWSQYCDIAVCRIVSSLRFVNPTPNDRLPWRLLAGGIAHTIIQQAGATFEPVSEWEWTKLDERMGMYGGNHEYMLRLYEPTRNEIRRRFAQGRFTGEHCKW